MKLTPEISPLAQPLAAPAAPRRLRTYALLLMLLMIAPAARANTYYIDYAGGSNSNTGTQASPWRTAPPMNHTTACDGGILPSGYTHHTGDHFIFKGGVSWPSSCFQMTISAGGASGTPDYYGVDQTWFTGGSWTRPKFAADGQKLGNGSEQQVIRSSCAPFSDFGSPTSGCNYVTFDNIEIGPWDVTPGAASNSNVTSGPAIVFGGCCGGTAATGVVFENMYIHDWFSTTNITGPSACLSSGTCSLNVAYGTIYGVSQVLNSTISDAAGHYVFNGSTLSDYILGGVAGSGEVSNTVIHDGIMATSSVVSVHDNEFYHIQGGIIGYHTHVIYEDNLNVQSTKSVYNNYVHDNNPGIVVNIFYESFIFNNIFANNSQATMILNQCPPGGTSPCGDNSGSVGWVANNTIDDSTNPGTASNPCYRWFGAAGLGTLNFYNNICIPGSSGVGGLSAATINGSSTNYTMGVTEAHSFGFVQANKYSPSSSDPNTAAKGSNRTSNCTGSLGPFCLDTSGAPWFGGSYKTRPTGSTPWDLGAFQGQGGTVGPPSISISSPSPGAVSGSVNLTASCTPQGTATVSSIQFTIDGFTFGAAGTASPYTLSWATGTAANTNHVIGASCTDSNAQVGTAGAVTVTVSNSIPGCFVSTDNDSSALSWTANQAFSAQSANFTATVTLTPNTNAQDSVIALSQAPMNAYGQGAALVRFNSSGFIDVYKGSTGYTSDNSAPYTAGTAYTFTYTINFTGPNAGTYSVAETSPSSIVIATNYAFRSTAPTASLGFINAISDNTTPDTSQVCGFALAGSTSLTFSPASLNLGSITVGGNSIQAIATTTTGGSVNFTSVAISGNADFAINSNTCTGSIPSSCATQIKFAPTSAALETATVTYTDDATGSPQTVAVSGTGVPATPTLSLNPTSVNFGGVQLLTTSSSGPIVLTISSGPVTFTGTPSFSGANAADFALASNTCTGTVSAASCQTVVSFTPSLVAAESATLTYTDSATGSPQSVALSGTGYLAPHPPTAVHAVAQ